MQNKKILMLTGFVILMGCYSNLSLAGLCDDPLRDQITCRKMQHVGSIVTLFDEQKELMQVNYSLSSTLGTEMSSLIKVAIERNAGAHQIETLRKIDENALQVARLARKQDPNALLLMNSFKTQCLNCHANENPSSGYAWSEVAKIDWNQALVACNKEGINPYLCRSMNGFASAYQFLTTQIPADSLNFASTEQVAAEASRIADDLISKNMTHGAPEYMAEVSKEAKLLRIQAQKKDPNTFENAIKLTQSCLNCHSSR